MSGLQVFQLIVSVVSACVAAVASYYAYKLHKLRIDIEKDTKNIHEIQKNLLQNASEFSKQLMTQTLKIAPQVAFSPYQQLLPMVSPVDISLFDQRRSHFSPEKELLAKQIVDILCHQIEADTDLSIILILDAGSTVFPIFRLLCNHPTFQFDRNNARRLKLITNNLPGVSDLTTHGRIGERRVARTLFKCRVLRGYAHSEYEASLGDQTADDLHDAIEEFKQAINNSRKDRIKIVSVTTGNYLSMTDGTLARHPNHIQTKSKMLEVADDVYILAPLGKILPFSVDEINHLLGLEGNERYEKLPNWKSKENNICLVMTGRRPEYFPQLKPVTLNAYFARVQGEIFSRFKEDNLITIYFDPMDDVRVRTQTSVLGKQKALREYELPHQNLRDSLISKLEHEHHPVVYNHYQGNRADN